MASSTVKPIRLREDKEPNGSQVLTLIFEDGSFGVWEGVFWLYGNHFHEQFPRSC